MQAFGESRKDAKKDGTDKMKIFSFQSYSVYKKHIGYFLHWIKMEHPECSTLKSAKKYVNEWLQSRIDYVDKKGNPLSPWTIHTEAAALSKLFQLDKADIGRIQLPVRHRADIKRSRIDVTRDKGFSKTNNADLIAFCEATGVRKNVLQKCEGRDLWPRHRMEYERDRLEAMDMLSDKERAHLKCIREALGFFPKEDLFLHHRKDKGGKYRFAPIIGPGKVKVIERFEKTGEREKVFRSIPSRLDVHHYRGEYAKKLYKMMARPVDELKSQGLRKELYFCKGDMKGVSYDKRCLGSVSYALGHSRASEVARSYLYGL